MIGLHCEEDEYRPRRKPCDLSDDTYDSNQARLELCDDDQYWVLLGE